MGIPIPEGVPPPPGDPVPAVDTYADGRAADALNEALDTDLFAGGLLIGEATVNAKIGEGEDHNHGDNGEDKNDD